MSLCECAVGHVLAIKNKEFERKITYHQQVSKSVTNITRTNTSK